jgi:hypothetical protein
VNKIAYIFIFAILAFFFIKSFTSSLFFRGRDRVNFVVYDARSIYYSLNADGIINYLIPYSSDRKIYVPGGYSYYRVGALGKLASLDRDPLIYKRAFSSATSSFTHIYFYPADSVIHYGTESEDFILPNFKSILFYKSNAGFFDRVYILLRLVGKGRSNFTIIDDYPAKKEDFAKQFQGYFYQKTYREEDRTVKIMYTNKYKSAVNISSILEGNGIRVVDLSRSQEHNNNQNNSCFVVEDKPKPGTTAFDIMNFFGCRFRQGVTETSDIILELNITEDKWE